jgi:hypothetical protein
VYDKGRNNKLFGNLTGTGCHNLKPEEAIKIQNDFAKWIVEQLRKNL